MSSTRLPTSATKPPRRLGSTSVSKSTVLPRRRPRRSRERRPLGVRQRRGAPHPGADAPGRLVHARPVGREDLPEHVEAPALGHERQEVARQRRDAQAAGHLEHEAALGRRLHPRPEEGVPQLAVGREQLLERRQLVRHRLGPPRLAGERMERPRVAPRDRRVLLHAGSIRASASRTSRWWSSSVRLFRTRRSAIWVARAPTSPRSSARARRTSWAICAWAVSTSRAASCSRLGR